MNADPPPQSDAPGASLARPLAEARDHFRGGDLDGAKEILAGLLDEGWAVREVYLLLADIYRTEGETRKSGETLKLAAQAPHAPLGTAPAKDAPPVGRRIWVAPPLPVYWPVVIGAGLLALAAAVGVAYVPARFQWLGCNPAQLALVAAAGFLALAGLAASGLIGTFDQELSDPGPGDNLPAWVLLLAAGVLSAWLAVALFLWSAYVKGDYTRTTPLLLGTLLVLGTVLGITLGGGFIFWWLALNVLWESALIGWALGSIASPREWWHG
jgi:hypothetical protein